MPADSISEIIDTLQELRRLHQLNLELLEHLNVACGWLLDNNIELPNGEKFLSLLMKCRALLNEIDGDEPKILQYQKIADEKKQHFRTDEEEPVP